MKIRLFTLIELMTVMAIIVFLVGLLIPAVQKVRASAWKASCQNNLHGVGISFESYLHDSKDIMPVAAEKPVPKLNDDPRICDVMVDYLPSQKLLQCAGDRATESFFKTQGSSYEYHSMLGGTSIRNSRMYKRYGGAKTFVMYDYENFHSKNNIFTVTYDYDDGTSQTAAGRRNYLFADWHVGDLR